MATSKMLEMFEEVMKSKVTDDKYAEMAKPIADIFNSLLKEGFTRDEAMNILVASILKG